VSHLGYDFMSRFWIFWMLAHRSSLLYSTLSSLSCLLHLISSSHHVVFLHIITSLGGAGGSVNVGCLP
jgi:hypothetical protein